MSTNVEDESPTAESPEAAPAAGEGDDAAEADSLEDEASLRARVEELENERVEMMNRVTRTRADQSNLKRRSAQEMEDVRKFANQFFAGDLLRVIDSLDRALGAIPPNLHGFTWIDGILIFRAQVDAMLKTQGIERIEALGEAFDPQFHEAVAQDGEVGAEGVVQEVYQVGFMIHDRLLRPSLVRVGPAEDDLESDEELTDEGAEGGDGEVAAAGDVGAE